MSSWSRLRIMTLLSYRNLILITSLQRLIHYKMWSIMHNSYRSSRRISRNFDKWLKRFDNNMMSWGNSLNNMTIYKKKPMLRKTNFCKSISIGITIKENFKKWFRNRISLSNYLIFFPFQMKRILYEIIGLPK